MTVVISMRNAAILFLVISFCAFQGCKSAKYSDSKQNVSRILELIMKIDDDPDLLHFDYTPAVHKLADIGLPALRHGVLQLLLSENHVTRMHAETVLRVIVAQKYSFVMGRGWQDRNREPEFRKLWEDHGYDYKAPSEVRQQAYNFWLKWVMQMSE